MAPTAEQKAVAGLSPAIAATIERNDSFRFEALTLLEQARAKLAAIEAKPPADSSSVGVAALEPIHLAAKALLAGHGYRAYGTAGLLELLRLLYAGQLPEERLRQFVGVQALRIQGAKSLEAARAFLDTAAQLLGAAR